MHRNEPLTASAELEPFKSERAHVCMCVVVCMSRNIHCAAAGLRHDFPAQGVYVYCLSQTPPAPRSRPSFLCFALNLVLHFLPNDLLLVGPHSARKNAKQKAWAVRPRSLTKCERFAQAAPSYPRLPRIQQGFAFPKANNSMHPSMLLLCAKQTKVAVACFLKHCVAKTMLLF